MKVSYLHTCLNCATDIKVNALWFCCTTCKTQYRDKQYAVHQLTKRLEDELNS